MWNNLSKKAKRFLVALLLLIGVFWGLLLCYFFEIGITSHDQFLILLLFYIIASGVWLLFAVGDMLFYSATYSPEARADMIKMIALLICAFFAWEYGVRFLYNIIHLCCKYVLLIE